MDLSAQKIIEIRPAAFTNLPSLKLLDLSSQDYYDYYTIEKLEENIFFGTPQLTTLDLSKNNNLHQIGNELLKDASPDLLLNLTSTEVTQLDESSFKDFFENVVKNNGRGKIVISSHTLPCLCDVKWILQSKLDLLNILENTTCRDGNTLREVRGN